MAAAADVEHEAVVDNGAHVAALGGHGGQGVVAVERGQGQGVLLQGGYVARGRLHQFGVEALFEAEYLVLGTQYLFLIFFQLLRDVALGPHERLLAHPAGGHLVLVRVAHFEVVAEDVVEAHLETGDARGLNFALLQAQQVVLARGGDGPQFVELGVYAVGHVAPLGGEHGRVGPQFAGYAVVQLREGVHLPS